MSFKFFRKIDKSGQREDFAVRNNFESVNSAISFNIHGDELSVHLAPIDDFSAKEKINIITDGLKKIAHLLMGDKRMEKIRVISATSWIVAKHPELLKKFGFVITGSVDEAFKNEHFPGESRDVYYSFINRDDFISRYGD